MCDAKSLTYKVTESQLLNPLNHSTPQPLNPLNISTSLTMPVIELKIPNLGESISSVTFSKWLKPDGSIVSMDEPLCEIETEKANQELSADSAGKLTWVAK